MEVCVDQKESYVSAVWAMWVGVEYVVDIGTAGEDEDAGDRSGGVVGM